MIRLLLLAIALLSSPLLAQPQDRDSDRDGLSDYQEIHKYSTDPAKRDSDGDGVPDGDWRERREFTYTIRTVIQVMPAYDLATINDDYQDARVLFQCDDYVELEVIHYPFNTNATTIVGDKRWRKNARKLAAFLKPGVTTNFDRAMQKELLARLKKAGIDVAKLTDKEVVERVSKWALDHARSLGGTCVWAVDFEKDRPVVPASLRQKFDSKRGELSDAEMFDREIYVKGMFEHGTRGTCTTSANYLTGILRAVGIPTRSIVTIPVVDASNPRNLEMLEKRLTHHALRRDIVKGVKGLKDSFAAHTYNEVWVGGRWRRLNYDRLGQNILDVGYMGLMTRVHTFHDLATANLGGGWGLGRQKPSDLFRFSNPYTALTISDAFGPHCSIDNPQVDDGEHHALTVTKAFWFEADKDRPKMIGPDWHGAQDKARGNVLLQVREVRGGDGAPQYNEFFEGADKQMMLRCKGEEDVLAQVLHSWWVDSNSGATYFYARISRGQFRAMKRGKSYSLFARNESENWKWRIAPGLTLTRP